MKELDASTRANAQRATPDSPDDAQTPFFFDPLLWISLAFVLGVALPFLPVPTLALAIVGAVVLTALYVTCIVFFAVSATRAQTSIETVAVLFTFSIALWALMQFWAMPKLGALFFAIGMGNAQPTTLQWLLRVAASTLGDVALISAATLGGSLVARLIKSPNMLGPLCAMIAMIDIWGVMFGGIVSQLLEKAPQASAAAMASLPQTGAIAAASGAQSFPIPLPNIGAGDYLFLGLLFYALQTLGMNWRGSMKLTIALVTIVLLLVASGLPFTAMLPGLLPIGLGVAIPNLRYFRFTREENFAMLYAGILVIFLTIGLYFLVTSQLPPNAPATR